MKIEFIIYYLQTYIYFCFCLFFCPNFFLKSTMIKVFTGSMFSGKTTKLIQLAREFPSIVFKSSIDKKNIILSHNNKKLDSIVIDKPHEIYDHVIQMNNKNKKVILIDEVQFMDDTIINVLKDLRHKKHQVAVFGLDMDYLGQPFGCMPKIMAIANEVCKLHTKCFLCLTNLENKPNDAIYTKLLDPDNAILNYEDEGNPIVIGGCDKYMAVCEEHF